MRLFVAVDLDDVVRREVGRLIARMRSAARDDRSFRITWVAPDRLHLTLHFLANVDEETTARLADSIAAPIDLPAFRVAFGDVGTFSSRGRPNVMWLGVAEGRAPLIALQALVGQRLRAVGCEIEDRPFSPHLTLARLRQTLGTGTKRHGARCLSPVHVLVQGTGTDRGGRWCLSPSDGCLVDRVTLYESRLGREGATHTALAAGLLTHPRTASNYNGSAGVGGDGERGPA